MKSILTFAIIVGIGTYLAFLVGSQVGAFDAQLFSNLDAKLTAVLAR